MTLARRRREFADDRKFADDRTHFIRFLAYPRDAVVLRHDRESKCIGLVLCSARHTEREEFFDSSLRERGVFRFLASYVEQRERSFFRFLALEEKFHEADSSRFNKKSGLSEHEDDRQVAGIQGKDDQRNADISATQFGHEDDRQVAGIQGKDDRQNADIPSIRKTGIATTISYYYYYYSTTSTASTSAYYAEQS